MAEKSKSKKKIENKLDKATEIFEELCNDANLVLKSEKGSTDERRNNKRTVSLVRSEARDSKRVAQRD